MANLVNAPEEEQVWGPIEEEELRNAWRLEGLLSSSAKRRFGVVTDNTLSKEKRIICKKMQEQCWMDVQFDSEHSIWNLSEDGLYRLAEERKLRNPTMAENGLIIVDPRNQIGIQFAFYAHSSEEHHLYYETLEMLERKGFHIPSKWHYELSHIQSNCLGCRAKVNYFTGLVRNSYEYRRERNKLARRFARTSMTIMPLNSRKSIAVFICVQTFEIHMELINDNKLEWVRGAFKRFQRCKGRGVCIEYDFRQGPLLADMFLYNHDFGIHKKSFSQQEPFLEFGLKTGTHLMAGDIELVDWIGGLGFTLNILERILEPIRNNADTLMKKQLKQAIRFIANRLKRNNIWTWNLDLTSIEMEVRTFKAMLEALLNINEEDESIQLENPDEYFGALEAIENERPLEDVFSEL